MGTQEHFLLPITANGAQLIPEPVATSHHNFFFIMQAPPGLSADSHGQPPLLPPAWSPMSTMHGPGQGAYLGHALPGSPHLFPAQPLPQS